MWRFINCLKSVCSRNNSLMIRHLYQQSTRLLPASETSDKIRHPIIPDFMAPTDSSEKRLYKSYLMANVPRHLKTTRRLVAPQRGPHLQKWPKYPLINYRPVSLTCTFPKLIIVSQNGKHLKNTTFWTPTNMELIPFVQEVHMNRAHGKQVDAIVMDFPKAIRYC